MRKLLVNSDGLVLNAIEVEENANFQVPTNCSLIATDSGNPGDTWNGEEFIQLKEPITVKPDVAGFNKAVITAFSPQLTNMWLSKYPLFSKALDAGDWETAAAMIDVAGAEGTITSEQAVALRNAAIQFHLVPAGWKNTPTKP